MWTRALKIHTSANFEDSPRLVHYSGGRLLFLRETSNSIMVHRLFEANRCSAIAAIGLVGCFAMSKFIGRCLLVRENVSDGRIVFSYQC
ncbi:hypothetical protein BDW75DRAFT_200242, partial [Aspergillus navahoensis]